MNRQDFLKIMTVGGVSFLSGADVVKARDIKRGSVTPWGRLKFIARDGDDEDWGVHPQGDINLVEHITDHSTVNLSKKWNVADIGSLDEMVQYPMLFMHAELPPELSDEHRKNMREYLLRGGFLYAEDCVRGMGKAGWSGKNDFFFRKVIDELPRILPEAKLERLPLDHPIYHCFYHMPNGLPHMQGTEHGGYGLTLNGRLVSFISPSDNHCGWTARWWTLQKRTLAKQMGTNVYIYAMTQGAGLPRTG